MGVAQGTVELGKKFKAKWTTGPNEVRRRDLPVYSSWPRQVDETGPMKEADASRNKVQTNFYSRYGKLPVII